MWHQSGGIHSQAGRAVTQLKATILVTDGEERAALATVRSLGRAGYRVLVTSTRGRSLAGASRYASAEYEVPSALADPDGFVESMVGLDASLRPAVILPITEAALLAVCTATDRFSARIPFPDLSTIRRVLDKELITRTAPDMGIAVPQQHVVDEYENLNERLGDGLTFPVVIKPARSIAGTDGHQVRTTVGYAADWASLERQLEVLPRGAFPVLLQRRIVGPGMGVFLLLSDDRVLAHFGHRRIREKPPSGGVSVYRESAVIDQALLDRSIALLRTMGWTGVAMVEYKTDAQTGIPYLMEVNGRLWGSLQLAVDSGVDFPTQLVSWALGEQVDPIQDYRMGVRSRWWWGDIDHLLIRLIRSDQSNHLPREQSTRTRAILDFLLLWRPGDRSEVFRLTDPRPFLRETLEWFRRR